VIRFLEADLQEVCQIILVTAFTWDLVENERKEGQGIGKLPCPSLA